MQQMLRVQNFTVSSDGFGAGEGQSLERPFGHADPGNMFTWAGATASWPNRTDPGGSRGLDDYLPATAQGAADVMPTSSARTTPSSGAGSAAR